MNALYTGAGFPAPYVDTVSGTELRWVIERVCNSAAALQAEIIERCDILPPKVPKAGTDNKYKPIDLPPIPILPGDGSRGCPQHQRRFLRAGVPALIQRPI